MDNDNKRQKTDLPIHPSDIKFDQDDVLGKIPAPSSATFLELNNLSIIITENNIDIALNGEFIKDIPEPYNSIYNDDKFDGALKSNGDFNKYIENHKELDIFAVSWLKDIQTAILEGEPETYIDGFVATLLKTLDFNWKITQPIMVRPQTRLQIYYREAPNLDPTNQSCTPDVLVKYTLSPFIFLLVVENKPRGHQETKGKHKLLAQAVLEALSVYSETYSNLYPYADAKHQDMLKLLMEYRLPFMTVFDGIFRFYYVKKITKDYISNITKGYKPKDSLEIVQCSPDNGYNFKSGTDRKRIIEILMYFRHTILEICDKLKPLQPL